jgi:hypothetical protein
MPKQLLITITLLFFFTLTLSSIQAQVTPDDTNASDESEVQKIQDRLKKGVEEAKVKGVSTDDAQKRGFIGTVKRVSEEALTIDSRKGTQIITVNDDVTVLQDDKAFPVKNIEIDSQVVVMGYQQGEDFSARRILVLKKPLQTVKRTVWVGSITKIDKLSITLTTRSSEEKIFSLAAKPVVEDNSGAVLKIADVEKDQDVLLLTTPEDPNSQSVKDSSGKIARVHLLGTLDVTPTAGKETPTPTPKKK